MRIRLMDRDTGEWHEDDTYFARPAIGDTVKIDEHESWVIQMYPAVWIKNKATGIFELTLSATRFDDRVKESAKDNGRWAWNGGGK